MRHRTLHRWMTRLALAAVLALLLVPTTGRMAGMTPMPPAVRSSDAMPSIPPPGLDGMPAEAMAGHTSASTIAAQAGTGDINAAHPSGPQSPSPNPHDNMAGDCEYCLLLQTMTPLPAWIALAAPPGQSLTPVALAPSQRRGQRHPTGLGSRGPPRVA